MRKVNRQKKVSIGREIDSILRNMDKMDCTSEEYKKAAMNLDILCKANSYERKDRVSKDTIVKSAVTITTVGMILKHEELNVIATKAMSFIPRIF